MLVLYALILLALGGIVLGLLVGFSAGFITADTWLYRQYPDFMNWFHHTMGSSLYPTLLVFLIGLLLFLMGYNILRMLTDKSWRGQIISINNPLGEIRVSLAAVEEFIQKCGVRLADVREISSKIKPRRGEIRVYSRVSLWSGSNVPEIADRLQAMIKQDVESLLGPQTKVKIFVSVDRISPKGGSKNISSEPEKTMQPYRSESYN